MREEWEEESVGAKKEAWEGGKQNGREGNRCAGHIILQQ